MSHEQLVVEAQLLINSIRIRRNALALERVGRELAEAKAAMAETQRCIAADKARKRGGCSPHLRVTGVLVLARTLRCRR